MNFIYLLTRPSSSDLDREAAHRERERIMASAARERALISRRRNELLRQSYPDALNPTHTIRGGAAFHLADLERACQSIARTRAAGGKPTRAQTRRQALATERLCATMEREALAIYNQEIES